MHNNISAIVDVIVHKVLFFYVYCNDVLMQYCKVLGCNRTLLLAMMLYALYIALMLTSVQLLINKTKSIKKYYKVYNKKIIL